MKNLLIALWLILPAIAHAQTWEWARTGGGIQHATDARFYTIAPDRFGHVYAAGFFSFPSITLGSVTLTNPAYTGGVELLIAKYDTAGGVIWAKTAAVTGVMENYVTAAVTDAAGNLYVTGSFEADTIRFDTIALVNSHYGDMFLVKYDPMGNVKWAKRGASWGAYFQPSGLAADPSGNIIVTGRFGGALSLFGADTFHTVPGLGYDQLFVIKVDTSGNTLWKKPIGSLYAMTPGAVTTDAAGSIYITMDCVDTATTFETATFATNKITLAKYSSSGDVIWVKNTGSGYNDGAMAVKTDAACNVYVTGNFEDSAINFGATTLTNPVLHTTEVFLAKYDSSGAEIWAKSGGSNMNDGAYGMDIDVTGSIYIAGYFSGSAITFWPDSLAQTGSADLYVAKYSAAGIPQWVVGPGCGAGGFARALCADLAGNLYVAGEFSSDTLCFGTSTLTDSVSTTDFNVLIAKLNNPMPVTTGSHVVSPSNEAISIFPNPANSLLTISATNIITTVVISNVLGQVVYTDRCNANRVTANVSAMPAGTYFVRVNGSEVRRFVKQ